MFIIFCKEHINFQTVNPYMARCIYSYEIMHNCREQFLNISALQKNINTSSTLRCEMCVVTFLTYAGLR